MLKQVSADFVLVPNIIKLASRICASSVGVKLFILAIRADYEPMNVIWLPITPWGKEQCVIYRVSYIISVSTPPLPRPRPLAIHF